MNRNQHQKKESTARPLGQIKKDLLSLLAPSLQPKNLETIRMGTWRVLYMMIPKSSQLAQSSDKRKRKKKRN